MIPDESKAKIKEVLSHQPFLCEKVLLYDVKHHKPNPCDEESAEFFHIYKDRITKTADTRSGYWFGNIIGAEEGRVWGGRYYAGGVAGNVLVIVAKPFNQNTSALPFGPPIDSYFLDAVVHRVSQILDVACTSEAKFSISQVTTEGDQVFSELRSLEKCEDLWRSQYGVDEWLAVKDGTVQGHNKDRAALEKFVRESNIEPPVLYVPPKGKEVKADILSFSAELGKGAH